MKTTDNQLYNAAVQIAAALISKAEKGDVIDDTLLAATSVSIARAIAKVIPTAKPEDMTTDEIRDMMRKYCTEPMRYANLQNLLIKFENKTEHEAAIIIDAAIYLCIVTPLTEGANKMLRLTKML